MPLPRYFEKIAHKHYCHFYDTSYFFDTPERKKYYTPFKSGLENKEIADLYHQYTLNKQKLLLDTIQEWETFIMDQWNSEIEPDFKKSGDNALYDLKNRNNTENF